VRRFRDDETALNARGGWTAFTAPSRFNPGSARSYMGRGWAIWRWMTKPMPVPNSQRRGNSTRACGASEEVGIFANASTRSRRGVRSTRESLSVSRWQAPKRNATNIVASGWRRSRISQAWNRPVQSNRRPVRRWWLSGRRGKLASEARELEGLNPSRPNLSFSLGMLRDSRRWRFRVILLTTFRQHRHGLRGSLMLINSMSYSCPGEGLWKLALRRNPPYGRTTGFDSSGGHTGARSACLTLQLGV